LVALVVACSSGGDDVAGVVRGDGSLEPTTKDLDIAPTGMGGGLFNKSQQGDPPGQAGGRAPTGSGLTQAGINYHGGPVMLGTVHVYVIWYGDWTGNDATTIIPDLVNNIGGSPYYNINTTYTDGNNVRLSNSIKYAAATSVPAYLGKSLSDAQIAQVVKDQIGVLPSDTSGVYFVLTSADVTASSGFCTVYCGWHRNYAIAGGNIKYAFVGNPDRCPTACAAQTTGPNGNAGADGMASIIAHELQEAQSDPLGTAWYDRRGYEDADKCAWTFGSTSTASNGSKYNVTLGNRQFLIQRNWVNAGSGYCALSYP
jgi:hypothetical protein